MNIQNLAETLSNDEFNELIARRMVIDARIKVMEKWDIFHKPDITWEARELLYKELLNSCDFDDLIFRMVYS